MCRNVVLFGLAVVSLLVSRRSEVPRLSDTGPWDDGLEDDGVETIADASGNGHEGELIGALDSPWISGDEAKFGGAIDLELSGGWMEIDVWRRPAVSRVA